MAVPGQATRCGVQPGSALSPRSAKRARLNRAAALKRRGLGKAKQAHGAGGSGGGGGSSSGPASSPSLSPSLSAAAAVAGTKYAGDQPAQQQPVTTSIRIHDVRLRGTAHHGEHFDRVVHPRLCETASAILRLRSDEHLRYRWLVALSCVEHDPAACWEIMCDLAPFLYACAPGRILQSVHQQKRRKTCGAGTSAYDAATVASVNVAAAVHAEEATPITPALSGGGAAAGGGGCFW